MQRDDRKRVLILPNDAMSRITQALVEVNEKMNSSDAAMVMVAKEVKTSDARGKLGIMKINKDGLIEQFFRKSKNICRKNF